MLTVDEALQFADQQYTKQSFAGVLAAEVRRLQAENERLRKDAERYQWLRDNEDVLPTSILRMIRDGDSDLDAAIDAARSAKT